ncbi:MAG TPA: GTP-binding protein, partial [Candidatus Melainabacteria bacterium]|nr:GTP-binding protein [Candidatus Melainabacteria bacterium]
EAGSELVIGFVDVPGHGKFLKNRLAGVGGIDMALLVIALDEGVMPQTVQHVKILSLLGVRSCILVFTKSDLADESEKEIAASQAEELLLQYRIEPVASCPF